MLAQLLRRMLLIQILTGAALAWVLRANGLVPLAFALLIPLVFPLATMLLVVVWTCAVSRADEPFGHWWRSIAGESWAGIKTFLLRQPWAFQPSTLLPATGTDTRIPVVLVHGFMCNHRIWDDIVPRLRANGHTVYAVNLEPMFGSIDSFPDSVEAAVQSLCAHTGQSQVALVGHSMGGLAIRAWLRQYGTARAARVITLGTPHHGTAARVPVPTTNASQMKQQSDWLTALAASETAATRGLMRIAITPQDNIVFPQRPQTLTEIEPMVFEGIGHLQMCTNTRVITWLVNELASLQPVPQPTLLADGQPNSVGSP